jgi:alcohol dehydrogenase
LRTIARLAKAFPVPDVEARYRAIVRNAFAGYLRAEGAGARDF